MTAMGQRGDGPASSVRGRLSDVLLGAICAGEVEAVMKRLGERAALDEPVFGLSRGDHLRTHVDKLVDWMKDRAARFEKSHGLIGTNIDVAEGTLFFGPQGARQSVPTAVVVERKREREVEVRLHFRPMLAKAMGPTLPTTSAELTGVVASAIAALNGQDHAPCFETRTRVRGADGEDLPLGERAHSSLEPISVTDDSRTAAVEVRSGAQTGVVVLERGEGGLIRFVRIYGGV
jgi:hypothetical protein